MRRKNGRETQGKQKIEILSENKRKIYLQFLQDDHTPPTPERKSDLENIGFSGRLKIGMQVKGPSARKKYQMTQKREYAPLYHVLW